MILTRQGDQGPCHLRVGRAKIPETLAGYQRGTPITINLKVDIANFLALENA